jgi:hypothetical protein
MPAKTLKDRETDLKESLKEFEAKYDKGMLNDFFMYWTEPNKSKTKMKFEMEKTWDLSRRLHTWERNAINWNKKNGINQGSIGSEKLGTSAARNDTAAKW